MIQKSHYLTLFFVSLVLFTLGLQSQEITGFDSRFYLFAREMLQHGASFFPTTYDQPYPDYSAASTWIIYLTARLFGGLNKLVAVLPTAIMAALTVAFTYAIGALRSKYWGWLGVLFLMLTVAFLKSARAISLDMYTTAICTVIFYILSAPITKKEKWILPLLALSFMFRGPIGLVVPAGIVCAFYLLDKNFKQLFKFGLAASIMLVVFTALLVCLAEKTGGYTFAKQVIEMQVGGRIGEHDFSHGYYFLNGFKNYSLSYLCAWLSIVGVLYYGIKNRAFSEDERFFIKLLSWMLVIMVGLSIPGEKKIRYILPIVPAASLLAAYIFVAPLEQKYFYQIKRKMLLILSVFPACMFMGLIFISHHFEVPIEIKAFLILIQSLVFTMIYVRGLNANIILVSAAICFVALQFIVIEPFELYLERGHQFVTRLEEQRLVQQAQLVFLHEGRDGLAIKYLLNMPKLARPVFVSNADELTQYKNPAFILSKAEYFKKLPPEVSSRYHVIAKDSLGHVPIVVLTNT